MNPNHIRDTPLLFLAVLLAMLGIGIEASIALDWHAREALAPIAWGAGGAAITFVVGHAIGISRFEMAHVRAFLLAVSVFFIAPFLIVAGAVMMLLMVWAVAGVLGDLF